MNTNQLRPILDWMKTTDLVEVSYKKGTAGFALGAKDAPAAISSGNVPPSRFVPVCAQAVGVFQWSAPGQPRLAQEGTDVAAGTTLAVIVAGSGAVKPVLSPCAGRVSNIFADAGEAVEYGRPLFLLEPTL